MDDLESAKAIARWAHRNDIYAGGKYFDKHLAAVAKIVQVEGPIYQTVAYLHDIVEDTDTTLDQLRAFGFTEVVVGAVDRLTKRGETYKEYIERLLAKKDGEADAVRNIAVRVKVADLTTNIAFSGEDGDYRGMAVDKWLPTLLRLLNWEAENGLR